MIGIILGLNTEDKYTPLELGDLVSMDDGSDTFYTVSRIEESKFPNFTVYEIKNEFLNKYHSLYREEINKSSIAFFDKYEYFNNSQKVFIGKILIEDINHIKGKFAVQYDLGFSDFDKIKEVDVIGLEFEGETIFRELELPEDKIKKIKYFQIFKNSTKLIE